MALFTTFLKSQLQLIINQIEINITTISLVIINPPEFGGFRFRSTHPTLFNSRSNRLFHQTTRCRRHTLAFDVDAKGAELIQIGNAPARIEHFAR